MYGQGQPAATANSIAPREQPALSELQISVDNLGERLSTLRSRLSDLSDRVFGSNAKEARNNPPTPVPNGAIQGMQQRINAVTDLAGECLEIAQRLDRIA